jgi:DNA-binding NarL/FixJ family response regulator/signal transduction histidine kinase
MFVLSSGETLKSNDDGSLSRIPPVQEMARAQSQDVSAADWNSTASQTQEVLRRQNTREVAAAILEGLPLEEVAYLITAIVAQRLRVERVGLYIRDERGLIVPVALRNISPEYGRDISRLIPLSPFVNRSKATGLPVFARNVQQDPTVSPELTALYRRENITSLLIMMLQYEQRFAGTLVVYAEPDREFTPADLSIFQGLADMATLSIALSQQVQQQREIAMLEERNRLAREIHDTVAQSLVALILQIDTTQTILQRGELSAANDMLTQAHGLAKHALEDTRRAVRGLAAASVQTLSPAQAIAQEAQQSEAESGIPTQFVVTGDEQPLTPDQRASLVRITQEALTNARKHARAQRIRVGLQFGADTVMLVIEDDGAGFDSAAPRVPGPQGGYGLFGIEERAHLIGANLQIDSTPGWGTRIQVTLPYRPSSPVVVREEEARGTRYKIQDNKIQDTRYKIQGDEEEEAQDTRYQINEGGESQSQIDPSPIRVLVVDDHAMARQGIRAMLQTSRGVEVIGEAENGAQAVDQAINLRPDVILMDWQMPDVDGLEGLRRLHVSTPEIPVVILTTFQTEQTVTAALAAGARGFLLKDAKAEDLLAVVRAARHGDTLLAPAVANQLAALASGQTRAAGNMRDPDELNEREREVLYLLAQGARNKEIANALFIASKTVEYHLSNIFTKLGVSNRTEAARTAVERGLVAPAFRPLK